MFDIFQTWQRFLDFITGSNYLPLRELPIAASLLYYCSTLLLARSLRAATKTWAPVKAQLYILDLIAAFQLVSCSLENVMIRRNYGFYAYCLILVVFGIWHSLTIRTERGTPNENFADYMLGYIKLRQFLLRTCVQIFAGYLSYKYARTFWSLKLSQGHGHRLHAVCTSDLRVPVILGFVIEAGGTFIDKCVTPAIYLNKSKSTARFLGGLWGMVLTLAGL